MSDTHMNEKVAKLEGKMESLDIYLPKLLSRFEHMEKRTEAHLTKMEATFNAQFKGMKEDFKGLEQKSDAQFKGLEQKSDAQFKGLEKKIDSTRSERWTQMIAIMAIIVAVFFAMVQVIK